jgi:uncharacterized UPF0160 family protein
MKKNNMNIFKKTNKLITHNGSFHADDIFACATLSIMLENKGENVKIIRTRDVKEIENGDYVFDVGGIYDEALNRFDHHQKGGAGIHDNGIEYSSFGLVWKKFGEIVSGNKKVADFIEQKIVSPVDAGDNGIDICKNNFENIVHYTINDVFAVLKPTALEDDLNKDKQFFKAVILAKDILKREIKKANDQIEITKIIQNFYEKSSDKRIIIIEKPKVSRYEIWEALQEFTEPMFAIYGDDEAWAVVAMRKEINSFLNRKDFPAS